MNSPVLPCFSYAPRLFKTTHYSKADPDDMPSALSHGMAAMSSSSSMALHGHSTKTGPTGTHWVALAKRDGVRAQWAIRWVLQLTRGGSNRDIQQPSRLFSLIRPECCPSSLDMTDVFSSCRVTPMRNRWSGCKVLPSM